MKTSPVFSNGRSTKRKEIQGRDKDSARKKCCSTHHSALVNATSRLHSLPRNNFQDLSPPCQYLFQLPEGGAERKENSKK